MSGIVTALIVIVGALIWWNHISPKLPERLRLNAGSPDLTETASVRSAAEPPPGPSHWTLTTDGVNLRLARELETPVRVKDVIYYPPTMHISCFRSRLYVWLDTQVPAALDAAGAVSLRINDGKTERWGGERPTLLVAPHPRRVIQTLLASSEVSINIAFEAGTGPGQSLALRTDGLAASAPNLLGCGSAPTAANH